VLLIGGAGRLKAELGSLAAVAEYEAAVSDIRLKIADARLDGAWHEGRSLAVEAAIASSLDEGPDKL